MKSRRLAREMAVQCLYLMDVCRLDVLQAAEMVFTDQISAETRLLCRRWTQGVFNQKEFIDALLDQQAENWAMERMAAIDRNILRLAAYEILNEIETPVPVVIDEAIELAKTYSTQDSGKFVNGILDKIKEKRPPSN